MVIEILIFLFSLFFIIFGAKLFVDSSVKIARKLRVSEFVIGLTLIALGTSLPELFSSIIASTKHETDLIAGTILGANIADLTLVIGIAAIIMTVKLRKNVLKRDIYMMILSILLLGFFAVDRSLSRIEGVIFLLLFLGYNSYVFYTGRKTWKKNKQKKETRKQEKLKKLEIFLFILGGIMLYLGAEGLVREAVFIANNLGVSIIVLGIIISIGTTLPELSVSITSSRENKGEIAVGNSIGSVITNTLLILGVSALIFPFQIAEKTIHFLIPILLVVSILLGISIRTKWKITRLEGIILVLIYGLFWFLTIRVIG